MILSGLWAVVSLGAAFASEISEPKFLDQLIEDVSTNRPKDKRLAPFVDRRLDQTWKQLQVGTPIPDAKSLKAFSKASRMFKDHWTAAEATSAKADKSAT